MDVDTVQIVEPNLSKSSSYKAWSRRELILIGLNAALIVVAIALLGVLFGQSCSQRTNQPSALKQYAPQNVTQTDIADAKKETETCRNESLESAKSRNDSGGVFDMDIPEVGSVEYYCDATTDGGNWIVLQRRMDGSVDFDRNWTDYIKGFGKPSGEYWLGLEALHQLTKNGTYELRIEMIENITDIYYYAKYSNFKVGPTWDKYRLSLSGYSGNATDAFAYGSGVGQGHNKKFSTRDADNDPAHVHCAEIHMGGWWYAWCRHSSLNGLYGGDENTGIIWRYQNPFRWMYMRYVEMKFRERSSSEECTCASKR